VRQAGRGENEQQQAGETRQPFDCTGIFGGLAGLAVNQPADVNQQHGQAVREVAGQEQEEIRQPRAQQTAHVVDLVGCHAVEWPRIGGIVAAQACHQVHRQQDAQYEKTLTEPVGNLAGGRFGIADFFSGLRQTDHPYQ